MASNSHTVSAAVKEQLDELLRQIEERLDADVVAIFSPMVFHLDVRLRDVLEDLDNKKHRLAIVLDTPGGIAEVVERMVNTVRHHYDDVVFLIPNRAMSAGTIFAMSGDDIYMDYFSVLGPIDPQVEREGKLVPALAYLQQYEELRNRAVAGTLTAADLTLLSKLDLAELAWFQQAKELSITLLKRWLTQYKFKDWTKTDGRGLDVTPKMKEGRAEEIATALNDHTRWHSHGRPLNKAVLTQELNLKVNDFDTVEGLAPLMRRYSTLLNDFASSHGLSSFLHTRNFF